MHGASAMCQDAWPSWPAYLGRYPPAGPSALLRVLVSTALSFGAPPTKKSNNSSGGKAS